MTDSSPVHLSSGFISPSGKQRQKKSGLGRPVTLITNYTRTGLLNYHFLHTVYPPHKLSMHLK